MTFKFLMLPVVREVERTWARDLARELPQLQVVICEDELQASREIEDADGVLGTLSPVLLAKARRLRWLQSRQAAPPAGYYYPELVTHRSS